MSYEKIPYASFLWKLGTTSFRTKEFNYMIERQLKLLNDFWNVPENSNQGWEKKYKAQEQKDIYEIKNRYYDYLVEHGFMDGNETELKYKTAREKTSGLYDMGLINENHRLTEAGMTLLDLSSSGLYSEITELGISRDSYLYLGQLLKLSKNVSGKLVRPLIIVIYLLSELDYLTYDEFKYLVPLCIDETTIKYVLKQIQLLREDDSICMDDILKNIILSKDNYKEGLERFCNNDFSEELLASVGMNRKSAKYDKPYVALYTELHSVFMEHNNSRIFPLFLCLNRFQSSIAIKWRQLLFSTSIKKNVQNDPEGRLKVLPNGATNSESNFKKFFFETLHLFKAKATLEDYLDLNRRYLGLTNCFLFEDELVRLDLVPKYFLTSAISDLFTQAFSDCNLLEDNCPLESISPYLIFNENDIIGGVNIEFHGDISNLNEAYDIIDKIRNERFDNLIRTKFSNSTLWTLLEDFENRNDEHINNIVTDNADIPTIFEYIIGIIWYKISGMRGNVLDFFKLSLDSNLLPITHAAGGEADIVWEYPETELYPKHTLLLEATLTDRNNQRRMEMEPVSRHLGNHLLKTRNLNSYCVFVTCNLNINVIGDFMNRRHLVYCDVNDENNYIDGMKIIPLETIDLKNLILRKVSYDELYSFFCRAYDATERLPMKWYNQYVNIENSTLGLEEQES